MVNDDVGWTVTVDPAGNIHECGDGSDTCHTVKLDEWPIFHTQSREEQGHFVGRLVAAIRRDISKEVEK